MREALEGEGEDVAVCWAHKQEMGSMQEGSKWREARGQVKKGEKGKLSALRGRVEEGKHISTKQVLQSMCPPCAHLNTSAPLF